MKVPVGRDDELFRPVFFSYLYKLVVNVPNLIILFCHYVKGNHKVSVRRGRSTLLANSLFLPQQKGCKCTALDWSLWLCLCLHGCTWSNTCFPLQNDKQTQNQYIWSMTLWNTESHHLGRGLYCTEFFRGILLIDFENGRCSIIIIFFKLIIEN